MGMSRHYNISFFRRKGWNFVAVERIYSPSLPEKGSFPGRKGKVSILIPSVHIPPDSCNSSPDRVSRIRA